MKTATISITNQGYIDKNAAVAAVESDTMFLGNVESQKDLPFDQLLERIGRAGHTYCGGLYNGQGNRSKDTWVKEEVFSLDFDNKGDLMISPDQAIERCEQYGIKPFGAYLSFSSKTRSDKFRLMFKHYKMVESKEIAYYIYGLFYAIFPEIDTACIDISRLFFGGSKEVLFCDEEAEFNVIELVAAVSKINAESDIEYAKDMIKKKCECRVNVISDVKKIAEEQGKEGADSRIFEHNSKFYMFEMTPLDPVQNGYTPNSTPSENQDDGKQFFGTKSQLKLRDALNAIKIPPGDDGIPYPMWRDILWGINNSFGEPAWNMALEWSLREKPDSAYKKGPRGLWDEFDPTMAKAPNVGTVYNIARDSYNWKFVDKDVQWFTDNGFFISKYGGKTLIFNAIVDPVTTRKILEHQDKKNFKDMYFNRKTLREGKKNETSVPAFDVWFESDEAPRFPGGVRFDPSNKLTNMYYNLWMGWKYDDANYQMPDKNDSKLGRFLDHIYRNISDKDDRIYNYVLNWMALAIQKPEIKAPVVLVLRSDEEGVGKGIFANFFGELFGDSFWSISHPDHIVGSFNGHLQNCVLLHSDEAEFLRKHQTVLKNLITEPMININPKGTTPFQAKSYLHIIMSSNSDFTVPAGIGSRRFCILDVIPNNKEDLTFFKPMRKDLESGGYKELFHRLKARDISNFEIEKYPETEALFRQRIHGLDKEYKFIYEKLENKILDYELQNWSTVTSDILVKEYREWVNEKYGHGKFKLSENEIGIRLGKLFSDHPEWKKSRIWKNVKQFDGSFKNQQVTVYNLPSIEQCRNIFSRFINWPIEWEEVDEESRPKLMESDEKKIINLFDFSKREDAL